MGIVIYPYPESEQERKVREKEGKSMRFFSFTVTGPNAKDRDEVAGAPAIETMKQILGEGKTP